MRPLLWDIYEEHLSTASFLWTQFERALDSPIHSLGDIASGFEQRLAAHLDGLVLGGKEVAERLLLPVLQDDAAEADVLWTAATVVLEERLEGGEELVLGALAFEAPELREAAIRALELSSVPDLEAKMRRLLGQVGPHAVAAMRVLHARDADVLGALEKLMASDQPEVAATAMRCLGPTPSAFARGALEKALQSSDAMVRDAAREAGLVGRMRAAWESCVAAVQGKEASRVALLAVAAGGGDASIVPLLADEALRPLALEALGYSGWSSAAEACLPWLGDKVVGGAAAEAFVAITGARVKPLLAEAAEEDEPDIEAGDEPPPTGPEEDLPRLDPEKVAAWWKQHAAKLGRERLLAGEPWSAAALSAALKEGPARRRHALAQELAVRTASAPAPTRRWARQQLAAPPSTARFDERGYGELCR